MTRVRFFLMWLVWTTEMYFVTALASLLLPSNHPSRTFILGRMKTAKTARDMALSQSAANCKARICRHS